MDTLYAFAYAPPSGKLARRLEQMANLGGFEASPIRIVSVTSSLLLLDASFGQNFLEVCDDGRTVRVTHGGQEVPAYHSVENHATYMFPRAVEGSAPGAALPLAEAPLKTWLSDGFHTSIICLDLSANTHSGSSTADFIPTPRSRLTHIDSAPVLQPADLSAASAFLPSSLEIMLGLERGSVLMECLHAAFARLSEPDGLALWCYELREASDRSAQGGGRKAGGTGADAYGLARSGDALLGGEDCDWRNLLAEASAEVEMEAVGAPRDRPLVLPRSSRASGGGGGRTWSASGGRVQPVAAKQPTAGAAVTAGAADGPFRVITIGEAVAALHASFSRSSLWRRRDHSHTGQVHAAAAASGELAGEERWHASLLEPVASPGGVPPSQLFVRLGVRPPTQPEQRQHPHQQQKPRGGGPSAGSNGRPGGVEGLWNTLDLVFVGCDQTHLPSDDATRGPAQQRGGNDASSSSFPGSSPLDRTSALLGELLARQEEDAGTPRPLDSTSRSHGNALCRRLAPLMAGNAAPHLLMALPSRLPPPGHPAHMARALQPLQLLSTAQGIRTVISKNEPPPPLYDAGGGSLTGGLAARADPASRDSDRQLAALLLQRHRQELEAAAEAYLQAAAQAAAIAVVAVESRAAPASDGDVFGRAAVAAKGDGRAHDAAQYGFGAAAPTASAGAVQPPSGAAAFASGCTGRSFEGDPWGSAACGAGGGSAGGDQHQPLAEPPPQQRANPGDDFARDPSLSPAARPRAAAARAMDAAAMPGAAAAATAVATSPAATSSRGSEAEPDKPGIVVGGLAKLQRRLEALQRARILREAATSPVSRQPCLGAAAAGRSPSASTGAQGGGGSRGGDSSRRPGSGTFELPRSAGNGSGGGGVDSCSSSLRSEGGTARRGRTGFNRILGAYEYESGSAAVPATGDDARHVRQGSTQRADQQHRNQQHQPASPSQRAAAAVAARSQGGSSPALPAAGGSGLAPDAVAAAERLRQLRVQFDRLYQGLVPEGLPERVGVAATGLAGLQPQRTDNDLEPSAVVSEPGQQPRDDIAATAHIAATAEDLTAAAFAVRYSAAPRVADGAAAEPTTDVLAPATAGPGMHNSTSRSVRSSMDALLECLPQRSRVGQPSNGDKVAAPAGGASRGQIPTLEARSRAEPKAHPRGTGSSSMDMATAETLVDGGPGLRAAVLAAQGARGAAAAVGSSGHRDYNVSWAALPHQGPAAGLYGTLLAGYAVRDEQAAARAFGSGGGSGGGGSAGGGGVPGGAWRDALVGLECFGEASVSDWRQQPSWSRNQVDGGCSDSATAGGSGRGSEGGAGHGRQRSPSGLESLLDSSSGGDEAPQGYASLHAAPAGGSEADGDSLDAGMAVLVTTAEDGVGGFEAASYGENVAAAAGLEGGTTWSVDEAAAEFWPWSGGGDGDGDIGIGIGSGGEGGPRPETGTSGGGGDGRSSGCGASLGSWNRRSPGDLGAAAATADLITAAASRRADAATAAAAAAAAAAVASAASHSWTASSAASVVSPLPRTHQDDDAAAPKEATSEDYTASRGGSRGPPGDSTDYDGATTGNNGAAGARADAGFGAEDDAGSASAAPNNKNNNPLRRQNKALLGVLERAAAGSEVLHGRLYELQLEAMELRGVMELRQVEHEAEVVRLQRHLRKVAAAAAVVEDANAAVELGLPPTGGGGAEAGWGPGAAAAAQEALVAAYEEQIDGLQRQVADLVAGQSDLALQCAQQELAALAVDAVRSRRRQERQARGPMQDSAAASRLPSQQRKLDQGPLRPQQQQHRRGGGGGAQAADPRRRRHSCGPNLGGILPRSPVRVLGARGRLSSSGDSGSSSGSGDEGSGQRDGRWLMPLPTEADVLRGVGYRTAAGLAPDASGGKAWQRCRQEMGALRAALRQSNRREEELRAALAATQQQQRAALLAARLAAGEGVRRRWLEQQAASLSAQLAAAHDTAAAASATRDTAHRDVMRLRTENQVLAAQLDDMRRLAESYAQLAGRAYEWT